MGTNFFDLSSPRDLLNKAKREQAKLNDQLNIDNIFNFFVTAYHIMDYVKIHMAASTAAIAAMYQDSDFEMCTFICNKAKHLQLRKQDKDTKTVRRSGGFASAPFATQTFAPWRLPTDFYVDGNEVKLHELADRIIQKWDAFFTANNIS